MGGTRFRDRKEAGTALAEALMRYRDEPDVVVLGLPRGGVPVAYEVARALGAPLDVYLVRKLGAPGQPELAVGAYAEDGTVILNDDIVRYLGVSRERINEAVRGAREEIARRRRYYGHGSAVDPSGKIVVVVDDGLATGASMKAAVRALKGHDPRKVVVAVPVASPEVCESLRRSAEEVVCVSTPTPFMAVGYWYEVFDQVPEEEVRGLLEEWRAHMSGVR